MERLWMDGSRGSESVDPECRRCCRSVSIAYGGFGPHDETFGGGWRLGNTSTPELSRPPAREGGLCSWLTVQFLSSLVLLMLDIFLRAEPRRHLPELLLSLVVLWIMSNGMGG